jgi:plasmid stabilization system protein ParE
MSNTGYAFHPEAELDLQEAWDYISSDKGRSRADYVSDSILDAIGNLVSLPHQGHRRPDLTKRREVRFISVHDYLVAYVPDKKPLWVLAVLYGGRRPKLLASILSGRK